MTATAPRVLLVDDSLTVRMDLTEALEEAQLPVEACTSVAEARAALARGGFGLIILDVVLPDGDGVDLLEQIRETPSLNGVPVILLSDEAAVRDRVRGLVTGADEYIGKPYDADYVVASAQALLRRGENGAEPPRAPVLVIDDSPTFCQQMREALEGAGYPVLTAGSGEAGLRLAAHARPAALIVDRLLPGIDGVAVLRAIRLDGALRHIPCLLLTASGEKSDEVSALEAGADAFVRKDEDIAIILARLHGVLRNVRDRPSGERIQVSLQGPKRVLVVDDDEAFLRQVTDDLRAEGYEIVQARSGEEGFDLLSAQGVDCILLDLDLGGIGSQEACRRIRNVDFSSSLPVIMTAGREDREAILRCLAAGADDYVAKSADAAVLRARVLAQIRRKQCEDENRLIRERLAAGTSLVAEARAAHEVSETRRQALERGRAEIAFQEFCGGLTGQARWSAMAMLAGQLSQEIVPALASLGKCLSHARRAAPDAPQSGHLTDLLDKAAEQAGRATAAMEQCQAVLSAHGEGRRRENLNEMVEIFVALGVAGGWPPDMDVNLALAVSLPPVWVNRVQILYVLAVILGNGVDAMRMARQRELTVTTAPGLAGTVRLTVADTGCGGAANIFDPPAVTVPAGAGLGLRTCRFILEQHGGRIWSSANVPAGMTVAFELPVADGPA